jgi:alkylation response protein AidB-like acyl-CoA dehydrogenase
MDFGLSEDQILLKDTIHRWLDAECPTSRVRSVMESDDGHDVALWKGLAELGVTSLGVPQAHGGAGLDLLDVALAAEELGWNCTPGPFLGTQMAVTALVESGNEAQAKRWLPAVASGDAVLSFALGEGLGEYDPEKLATRAADGKLSGEKPLVPYAQIADAIVVAALDADGPGLWLVERGAPGTTFTELNGIDMTRRLAMVRFEGTPATKLCGGTAAIARARDAGLILLAFDCYGGANRCLDMTAKYTLTREQFGQPIGAFQGVKHQLADLATDLAPSLSLCWYAAHAFDHIRDKAERHAAIVKPHLSDIYDRTTRYAIELHGGIGFTWEYDLQLWWRRAVFDRAFLGEARYHRARAADLAGW